MKNYKFYNNVNNWIIIKFQYYLFINIFLYISILNPFEEEEDEKKRMEIFESYHTLTIYYLSQVYSAKNMNDKSAKYSAMTLDRELRHSSIDRYVNIFFIDNFHL